MAMPSMKIRIAAAVIALLVLFALVAGGAAFWLGHRMIALGIVGLSAAAAVVAVLGIAAYSFVSGRKK
jgi:hypothetical protein